jgi:tetratricopeptide (TPR) repeat protein
MRDGQLSRERADRLEKERELADERSLRLEAARAEQERIANLFERVNDLRRDENLFAKELAASFPAPRSLNGNDEYDINEVSAQFLQARGVVLSMDGLTTVDLDEVAELEDRRAKLAERRKELAAMVGEERLEQEPTALTLSEANMQLKLALSPSGALAAYGLFEQAKSQLPQDPDPLVGMAVAAARADHVTSAIALLEEAAVLARRAYGEDSPRTADVLGLAGDAAIQLGDDEAVFRYFNRSSDLLEERWIDLTKKLYLHTYHTGDFRRANELAEIVLAAKERNHPRDSWEVQSAKITYSSLLLWKGDLDKAEELILDAIDSMEGDDESTRMHRAQAMAKLARIQTMRGHYREAEAMLREAQDALEDTDLDASNRGAIRTQLADCLFLQGNYQESLGMFEEAEAILVAAQGGQHPNAIIARNGRVRVLKALGRFAEAERMLRDQMAALDEIALDPDHSLRGNTLHSLAAVLGDQGRFRDAVPVIAETLRIYRLKYPPNSTRTAEVLGTISNIQKQLGNMAEAVTAARESLAIWNLRDDPLNPNRLNVLNTLAVVLDNSGEEHREEAARLYQEALEGMKAIGHKKDGIASTMGNLAVTLTRLGRKEEAEKLLRDALDLQVEALGPRHPFVGVRHNSLAFNLMGQARYDDAEPHLRAALDIQRETLGDHIDTGISLYNLAQNLGYQGKWEEGEPLLDEAIKLFIEAGGDRHPHVAAARGVKARLLESQKRYLEAAETRRQLASHWEIVEGLASTKAVNERDSVAVNLYRAEAWKEAAAWMAGNYRLDDKTTELAYRRLEWLGLCLLRSGEHADAAAPIATALRWQVARAEGDPVRDPLSRKFASSLLEVVASAPTERADHALALRLSAWLEHGDASVESTSLETVSVDLGWGTAGRLAAQSTALAASNPASLDAAKRLALRAAALANAAKLGPEHRARLLWLDPLLARLGLAEEASALPAPPETLWPGPATAPVQSAALTAWLDEVVPPVDWSALAPDAAAWTIDQLEPRGEELARALEKSVERAAELGDGPAAARLRAKN